MQRSLRLAVACSIRDPKLMNKSVSLCYYPSSTGMRCALGEGIRWQPGLEHIPPHACILDSSYKVDTGRVGPLRWDLNFSLGFYELTGLSHATGIV